MSHNHKHHCFCNHDQVKYCRHCNTVYCLSCSQEFSPKTNWTWTTTYPWYQGQYTAAAETGIGSYANSNKVATSPMDTTTVCKHSE